ncbi:AI-2E family transporter [Pseudopontixanthobacter vadosimaris]|uniref:AI-2E family transporter n=1 Tax=Pseudopontixanthobacter vadosimaris TaxID=2726450 RepID=UPI001F0E8C7C|nr:AI-2E family transporter [Pseudopontixanthobacter vadosimaris]
MADRLTENEPAAPRPGEADADGGGSARPAASGPGSAVSAKDAQQTAPGRMAAQEIRLISALVLILGLGLFLALPFVLSIGSVVFLPLVTAIILTILLSPLADRIAALGLPNVLASFLALLLFLVIVIVALGTVLQPAADLFDSLPEMIDRIVLRYGELRQELAWLAQINEQLTRALGSESGREVVLATPTMMEQVAFATPTVVLEVLLTFLMAFFMIEARVRLRRHLLLGRSDFGSSIKAARVVREVQDRVAAYILTVSIINICVGIVVAAGAWALGVEAPVMWGGLAAILNFLPYIGPLAMVALLGLFGIGTTDTILLGLVPAGAYLALHAVEANVVTPSILGARFTMNPVMILIALSYFSWIWGVVGALLSVPLLLMLTALIDHVGRPNLIGFMFGESLFPASPIEIEDG